MRRNVFESQMDGKRKRVGHKIRRKDNIKEWANLKCKEFYVKSERSGRVEKAVMGDLICENGRRVFM